jgi:hypothetical protein
VCNVIVAAPRGAVAKRKLARAVADLRKACAPKK